MVDEDKQACCIMAEQGYHMGLWSEDYLTWDFLKQHPKVMEPEYLHLNWNDIPGMYCRKHYIWTLAIDQEEWARLSDPAYLTRYWEPTQDPGDFHHTFALVLCQTKNSDCTDKTHRKEFVVSVAIVGKPACFPGLPFSLVADRLDMYSSIV